MEENKKSKKGLVIAIVLLVLVVLGLVGYICYDKGLIFKSDKEVVKKEKKETERVINDSALKKDLSKKINYLNFNYYWDSKLAEDNKNSKKESEMVFRDSIFKKLNSEDKALIALSSITGHTLYGGMIETLNINNSIKQSLIEEANNGSSEDEYVKEDEFVERYKELYGEKPDFNYKKDVGICPSFIYDSTNKLFVRLSRCGGTSATSIALYKNKYTKKGNNAYVYVNYGYITPNNNSDSSKTLFNVYGLDKKTKYKENLSIDDVQEFQIDETNYKEFPEYKYTFKKDKDGNYYFVSVKKTK